MRCKVGDLVIIKSGPNPLCAPFVGGIRTVRAQSEYWPDSWLLDPPTMTPRGEMSWRDCHLIPIRDQPGTDEMIRIAGLPKPAGGTPTGEPA